MTCNCWVLNFGPEHLEYKVSLYHGNGINGAGGRGCDGPHERAHEEDVSVQVARGNCEGCLHAPENNANLKNVFILLLKCHIPYP